MIPLERFNPAMQSERVEENLRQTILDLAQEGHSKEEIMYAMDHLLDHVREVHSGAESAHEDRILEVMDALTGWCHPKARLL
jgi:hypothetical protein